MQAICASRCRAPVRVCVCVRCTCEHTNTLLTRRLCGSECAEKLLSSRSSWFSGAQSAATSFQILFFFASAKPSIRGRQILEKRCNAPVSDKAIKEVCERHLHRRAPALRELSPFSAVFVRTRRTLPSTFASSRHCPPLGVVLSVRISL